MRAWSEQRTPRGPWAEVHTKVGPACAGVPEDPEEYAKPCISALRLNMNGPKTRLHHEDMWLHKDGLKDVNAWWWLGSQGFKNVNACLCSVTVGKGKDQLRSKLENIMSKCINFGLNDPCARLWSDSRRVRKGNRELSSLPVTDSVNQTVEWKFSTPRSLRGHWHWSSSLHSWSGDGHTKAELHFSCLARALLKNMSNHTKK